MSAVSHVGNLSPYAQIEQYCTALGSILPTLWERTDEAFKRVHVQLLDEDGNIRSFIHRDARTGEKRTVFTQIYIEDVKTGDLYVNDSDGLVAFKCFLIFFGMPFYTVGAMSWHAAKAPIMCVTIILDTIYQVGQQIVLGRADECSVEMRHGFSQLPDVLGNGLFEIVKAPIFALGIELVALYGILKPYQARKYEALIENAWQKGASYKDDFRRIPAREGENCWEAFVKDVSASCPFYLADCFQVRNNLNNPLTRLVSRENV